MQKEELLTIQEQMVTDQEEITGTAPEQATEDRRETETVREDHRAKAELRAMEIVRADASAAREDPRVTVRDARAEDHRAMEIVRVDVSAAREDLRAITVREADHRVTVRAVRMETEVKDALAAVRVVRDSVRIPERMTIWDLHQN